MTVAILGSSDLDFFAKDMYRYVCNCTYPHPLDRIVTTSGYGVAETAREIGSAFGIPVDIASDERSAVDMATMVVVFRKQRASGWLGRYCTERGKLFKEYVVRTS